MSEGVVRDDLMRRTDAILRAAPTLMEVLRKVRDLDLPDWMIFSGAIYQRVLNHLTGRDPDYGIRDYDVGYFDPSDTSYEAEDAVIRRAAAAFEPPLREMVEVRNQARVHLWFEGKFGEPYSALRNTAEALSRFTTTAFSVGARLEADDRLTLVAPLAWRISTPFACVQTRSARPAASRSPPSPPRRAGRNSGSRRKGYDRL